VVVQVLVAKSKAVNPQGHQFHDVVIDPCRIPPILEAGGKAGDDSRPGFYFPKLEDTPVGGDKTAVEPADNLAGIEPLKFELQLSIIGVQSVFIAGRSFVV
jgi:hypothetical protein